MSQAPNKNIVSVKRFSPNQPPQRIEDLPNFLYEELGRLSSILYNVDSINVVETHIDPETQNASGTVKGETIGKPRLGDIRLADGVDWNPGSGQSFYWYDGTNWLPFGAGGGSNPGIEEAPIDGQEYVRLDGEWVLNTGGTGVPEAPIDTVLYGRQDGAWVAIPTSSFSGNYDDLTNKPNIPSDIADLTDNTNLLFSGSYNDLTDQPNIPSDIGDLTDTGNLLDHFSGDYNDLINQPDIPSDVGDLTDTGGLLFSGSYNDLTDQPTLLEDAPANGNEYVRKDNQWVINTDGQFSGDYNDLTNKPDIPSDIGDLTDTGNLLFTGDYNDLVNQPSIPGDVADLTDNTNLLFSGDYNDLSNQPTIPTVNDSKITFIQDSVEKGSFTLNQPNDQNINITDFVGIGEAPINQTQYARQNGGWAALNVEWQDVTQKPDLVEEAPLDSKKYVRENGAWVEDIDTHFSGDYNDLTNKPDIPTDVGQLTDNGNLLDHFSGDYNDLTNKPNIPIDINDLTDIDGNLFSGDYNDLTNQPTIGDGTITINEAGVLKGTFSVNQTGGTIINLDGPDGTGLGEAPTDGTDYVRADGAWRAAAYFSGVYDDLTGKPNIPSDVSDLTDTGGLLFSGDYNDLTNTPTIPAAQVNSDWNATSGVEEILNKPTIPSDVGDLTDNGNLLSGGGVPEAPNDGDKYVRQSLSWVQLPSGAASGLKWIDYATGFSAVPSVIDTVDNTNWSEDGDVYEYTYSNGTLYRVIGATIDAFYNTFNAVSNPALSGLVAQKSITI